jgi:lipopolysaccharide export system protein LptA
VRFTIERLRTVLLVVGVLLVSALGVFLARGRLKLPFTRDIPKRLGIQISQEANGVTYTQSHGGHTLFKIHASKVVQLKNDDALLHDVKIEIYGPDGSRVDRIEGNEFEYDQRTQIAKTVGPVEITMARPTAPSAGKAPSKTTGATVQAASDTSGDIHVKTSGLVFDRNTGVATTEKRVDFSSTQGSGNSIGATYDSENGHLVLDHQVELNVQRNGEPVAIHAQHAEFNRDDMLCHLLGAKADYRDGDATAGAAKILFREDGSAVRLDATDGFTMETATGSHLAAPTGWLEFNESNQPKRGHLEGGVTMDSATHTDAVSRQSHATSPSADLEFASDGELRHTHLERGVELKTEEQSQSQQGPLTVSRTWKSPVAEMEFRDAGGGQVEPDRLHGLEGVVITGESRRGSGAPVPSRLAADDVTIDFGPGSTLRTLTGVGHASLDETTATGTRQSSSGDWLEAHFAAPANGSGGSPVGTDGSTAVKKDAGANAAKAPSGAATQIESATLEGHVVITQQGVAKPGTAAPAAMRATAGRADYEGGGERVHLTESPRVDDGGLELSADQVDVAQASGDAFAHGNVKATWLDEAPERAGQPTAATGARPAGTSMALGGKGPAHVVAAEAQMHQATGEATFRGNARLWQEANSVAAPVIVLNQKKQTLVATSTDAREPVRVVLLSASAVEPGKSAAGKDASKPARPSVIRVSGSNLKYSDAERKAVIAAGAAGSVTAETPTARTVSDQVELLLLPAGNHAGKDGGAAQVDKMTATGHVVVSSEGRRGTGTQLVYTGETGEYVLTGTASAPPKMTDPTRGTVMGEALIFHSRDDSVSIEGGGQKTTTETRTPR